MIQKVSFIVFFTGLHRWRFRLHPNAHLCNFSSNSTQHMHPVQQGRAWWHCRLNIGFNELLNFRKWLVLISLIVIKSISEGIWSGLGHSLPCSDADICPKIKKSSADELSKKLLTYLKCVSLLSVTHVHPLSSKSQLRWLLEFKTLCTAPSSILPQNLLWSCCCSSRHRRLCPLTAQLVLLTWLSHPLGEAADFVTPPVSVVTTDAVPLTF